MTNIEKKVKAFAKKASTVEHSGEIAYIVTRSDIVELNKSIESKIRQNERERTASMHAASRCIVGGKWIFAIYRLLSKVNILPYANSI